MSFMQALNATDVRRNWSCECDKVRIRPSFIRRTHDNMFLSSADNMLNILSNVIYLYDIYKEDDDSYTVSLVDLDLAENGKSKDVALSAIASAIYDYAEEYYDNYELYSKATNRQYHLPYITKALLLGSEDRIREELICRNGEN